MKKEQVKELLKKIKKIPTLPSSITRIIAILNNPNTSAQDVNKVLSTDQGMSAKVLKLVNSSYYGLARRVNSITQAIVILGFNTVKSLALSASMLDLFSSTENKYFSREEFWTHSFGVAIVAKLIAQEIGVKPKQREEYFLCGLLHDIGKIILDQYFIEEFNQIIDELKSDKTKVMYKTEKKILNLTHSDIGGFITDTWDFPEDVVNAIEFHHKPDQLKNAQFSEKVIVTHLANILTKTKKIGFSGDYNLKLFNQGEIKKIITFDKIKDLLDYKIDKEFEQGKIFLSLI